MATAESTQDRGSAPFALCTSCQVGFEVPDDVWAKGYREVRCGSCNVKFDLHEGIAAAKAVLAGETLSDDPGLGLPVEPGTEQAVADAPAVDATDPGTSGSADDADQEVREIQDRRGFERYLYDDLEMDQTVTDFDLFSDEAGLPEVAYFERFDAGTFAAADEAAAALLKDPQVSLAEADPAAEATDENESGARSVATGAESAEAAVDDVAARVDNDEPHDAGATHKIIADVPPEQPLVFAFDQRDNAARRARADEAVGHEAHDESDTGDTSQDDLLPEALQPTVASKADDAQAQGAAATGTAAKSSPALVSALLRGVLLLAIALAAFGSWMVTMHQHPGFYNSGFWRPAVVVSCRVFACVVPSRVDLDQLVLVQRNVYSHPSLADALVVNVSFRNEASFAQRYPVLVVRFSDSLGRPVARRNFKPEDYFDDWRPDAVIGAGRRLDINLEIEDPGEAADSFEISFRAS